MKKLTFSVKEVSKMSSLSVAYLHNMISTGYLSENAHEIKIHKLGKYNYYLITCKGVRKITGQDPEPGMEDYLEEIARRIAGYMEKKAVGNRQ